MDLLTLSDLANAKERIIIGLMSGTSIDGLDIGLFSFKGYGSNTRYEVLKHGTVEYTDEERQILHDFATQETVNMEQLCIYHAELSRWHARMIRQKLSEWQVASQDVDLIASHGQTIRHAPKRIHGFTHLPNSTFQLGDGDHLAWLTGITTVCDFRQKHVVAGGEGAPLAVYGDRILFNKPGEFRVLVNIGGISNITILDGSDSGKVLPLTFDTGPGNTLIDHVVRKHFSPNKYDNNGDIAARGTVNEALLTTMLKHPYFSDAPPKTTGPELLSPAFLENSLKTANIDDIRPEDLVATLTKLTSASLANAIKDYANPPQTYKVYISGGGVHNRTILNHMRDLLPGAEILNFEKLGVHPDAKEALFFASMANELVCGQKFPVEDASGNIKYARFGKICLPD